MTPAFATFDDIPALLPLLIEAAQARARADPNLWQLTPDAAAQTHRALVQALTPAPNALRQRWLLLGDANTPIGALHTLVVPVPPIYAAPFGAPGLIMEDSALSPAATDAHADALITAAQDDMASAGVRVFLASSRANGPWQPAFARHGYVPLTDYLVRTGPRAAPDTARVRPAETADLPAIVTASAEHRSSLETLHPTFWQPHPQADARFSAWMARSLTLPDRRLFVSADARGYVIAQPATPLHFPPAHATNGIGVIDDFHHPAFDDPNASALLRTAEGECHTRGQQAVMVVCPAAWHSKRALLESEGYAPALTWFIKIPTVYG